MFSEPQASLSTRKMPQFHQILTGGPQYAPPVLRAPSPTCSIGTAYGDDATSLSDKDLDQDEFERKCEDRLRLNMPRPEEIEANIDPKLPRPKTATEEKGELVPSRPHLKVGVILQLQ